MSHHHQSVQDDSISGNEAQPEFPSLLGLPLEIREKIFRYILPSDTCLRIDRNYPSYYQPTPQVWLYPTGPAIYLTTCKFNECSNKSGGGLLRDCVYWDGARPIDKGMFGTSQALQSEAIAFLFRHNTLALDGVSKDYTQILGPWSGEARSVLLRTSIMLEKSDTFGGRPAPKTPALQEGDISALVAHFQNLGSLLVCACVCGAHGNEHGLDEEYALSIFRVSGQCNPGNVDVKVELSTCRYHPIKRRSVYDDIDVEGQKGYLASFEARCMEELENARLTEA